MTSNVIGAGGARLPPCFLSSFSSCCLDFFLAFLPPASPPPVGMCVPPWNSFGSRSSIAGRCVSPGEDELSARLDRARAVSRRAERRLVALADAGGIDPEHLLPWANRLSDVLFVLSRAVEPGARPARE